MSSGDREPQALVRDSRALGVELDAESAALLIRYLEEIYFWNATAGLTTVPREEAARLHLLDSLSVVPCVAACDTIVDLGSGAGLPGVPIAVALPRARVTLVESRRKKCTFLSQVVRTLGLANCTVLERDARKPGDRACAFAAVVARAFLPAEELIDVGKAFLKPNGRIVIMGARRERELETLGSRHPELVRVDDRRFQLPGGRERRRIVVFASRA